MYFLLNDVVLNVDLQQLTPPAVARQFSALTLAGARELGREIFSEEPALQHNQVERAKRLAGLLVSKAPEVNAALFVAPARGCSPQAVAVRLVSLDLAVLAQLYKDQQEGQLTPAIADELVWARAAA